LKKPQVGWNFPRDELVGVLTVAVRVDVVRVESPTKPGIMV
jgi:hypothetical protein